MNGIIIIGLLLFSVICIIEAKLESITIALKNPDLANYPDLNAQEHKWSAIYYLAIAFSYALVSFLAMGFNIRFVPYLVALLVIRRIFFDFALKIIRKRPVKTIEGDQPLDTAVRKVFGVNGGLVELAVDVAILAGMVYLSLL
jgi:hypothetical protein